MKVGTTLLCVTLVAQVSETETFSAVMSGLLGLTSEILRLTSTYKDNGSGANIDVQTIINSVNKTVEKVSKEQFQKITAYLQLNKLDEVRRKISSVLVDLQYLISSMPSERDVYKKTFTEHSYGAIEAARSITSLVKESIPGTPHRLLQYISEECRCNGTALDIFQDYCRNLLLSGRMIELVSKNLQYNLSLNKELLYWNNSFAELNSILAQQTNEC